MLLARCQSKHSLPSFPSGSTDSDNYLLTSVLLWESEGTVEKFQHTVEAKILGIATLKRVKKSTLPVSPLSKVAQFSAKREHSSLKFHPQWKERA